MVALLHPHRDGVQARVTPRVPETKSPGRPGRLRLVVDNTLDGSEAGISRAERRREQARLRSAPVVSAELELRSIAMMIAAAAIVVFGALLFIRTVQGSPSEAAGVEVGGVTSSAAGVDAAVDGPIPLSPGDEIVTALPGDSMWSIAVSISPDSDPRPAVAALIEANGGDSIRIGQQIVIPGQLLD